MSRENGSMIGHFHCIANEIEGKRGCASTDALAVYEHDSENGVEYDGYCYSCNQHFTIEQVHNSSVAVNLGIKDGVVIDKKNFVRKSKSEPITNDEAKEFVKKTGYFSNNYRGIKDEYNRFFGHLTKVDSNGIVLARYYPETEDGKIVGYKCRNHPKDFRYGKIGKTGINSDLSGEVKFKSGGKYVLITAGEEDKVAAYQMLKDSQVERGQGEFESVAVVSPTTGEPSAARQIARRYDFLDTFDVIIIGMDNDDVGRESAKAIAKVLPEDKVKIVLWSGKDPNQMLLDGKQKQFVRDFYNAKPYVEDGIKSSASMMDAVMAELDTPRLTLPHYMYKMQNNMGGGILDGTITNVIADTSVGKSSHVNNMVYHWLFNSPNPVTIISLEATEGQWGTDMLSLHLQTNLRWMHPEERKVFLTKPEIIEKANNLWFKDNGEPRFYIIDEREGKIERIEKQLDRAYKQYGSRIMIIDVLTDILRGMDSDKQESHMLWQKMFVKKGVRIINVLHTRKPPKSKDGKPVPISEYDAYGSSTFVQSAAINVLLERDKEAESPMEKNTTYVRMPKCRGGVTGACGEWFYDFNTRQCFDRDEYLADLPNRTTIQQEENIENNVPPPVFDDEVVEDSF